jgi:hypothetical protein
MNTIQQSLKQNQTFNNTASVFTFDNNLSNKLFVNCCDKIGVPYTNLGDSEHLSFINNKYPTDQRPRKYLIFKDWKKTDYFPLVKMLSLYHYIKSNPSAVKKYVYMFDQSDVYLTDNPESKLELFKSKNCGMMFGAESKCMYFAMRVRTADFYSEVNKYFANYGDVKKFEKETYGKDCFEDNGVRLCYLNGGCMVCERDYFVSLVDKYVGLMEEFMNLNEQTIMHHLHFLYYPEIQIDNKCEMFQCMGPKKVRFNV